MPEPYQEMMKGTTTVGLIFDGGVILSTEKRATMGYMIASKKAKKVYQIANRIGMTTAGGVGDAQQLARIITVECNLYQIRRSRPITVGSASTLLSTYLNQNRYFPFYVQLLVGGVDESGPSIYSVDAMGGASKEEEIVATGSGSPMAYGVLEDRFRPKMKEDEAIDLSIRALSSAMKRDAGSGEGINVVVITMERYHELSEEEIRKYSGKIPA
jgi:proteasome beta subunit